MAVEDVAEFIPCVRLRKRALPRGRPLHVVAVASVVAVVVVVERTVAYGVESAKMI